MLPCLSGLFGKMMFSSMTSLWPHHSGRLRLSLSFFFSLYTVAFNRRIKGGRQLSRHKSGFLFSSTKTGSPLKPQIRHSLLLFQSFGAESAAVSSSLPIINIFIMLSLPWRWNTGYKSMRIARYCYKMDSSDFCEVSANISDCRRESPDLCEGTACILRTD